MQLPQTEHIRSALRPLAAQPEISTDTAAAQDDAMGVPIANCARTAAPLISPKNCTSQHSDRSAVSYAVPADGIYPLRVTSLAAQPENSAETTSAQDVAMLVQTITAHICSKPPQRNAAPLMSPENLHLAAFGT